MAKKPQMIGAHVPQKPATRRGRCSLYAAATEFNRAYNERFASKRTHLVYQPTLSGPRSAHQ